MPVQAGADRSSLLRRGVDQGKIDVAVLFVDLGGAAFPEQFGTEPLDRRGNGAFLLCVVPVNKFHGLVERNRFLTPEAFQQGPAFRRERFVLLAKKPKAIGPGGTVLLRALRQGDRTVRDVTAEIDATPRVEPQVDGFGGG